MSEYGNKKESAFFGSSAVRRMNEAFDSFYAGDEVTPAHFQAVEQFFDGLRGCFTRHVMRSHAGEIKTEGGSLTPGSFMRHFSVHASPLVGGKKGEFAFESAFVFIGKNNLHFYVRPFPVTWRMGHIESRHRQRSHGFVDYENDVCAALPLYYLMQELIEEGTDWRKTKEVPVAVPLGDGLCLGLVEPIAPESMWNRRGKFLESGGETPLVPLLVQPKTSMNLYTYIGANEMTPAQKRIHAILTSFTADEYTRGLDYGIDRYRASEQFTPQRVKEIWGDGAFEAHHKVRKGLGQFMNSKLWRGNVRPPRMIKTSGGALIPR